jgi:nucleoside-diphosphate-sugar epimerase
MSAIPQFRSRVLVTGAEGLVGTAVVTHLRARGHEVTTLTLPDVTPHPGVRVVRGDARDPAVVAEAVDGMDAVAHLAAIPSPYDDPATTVFGNNTLATFTVLWTAAEHGVRRFVIASSVNALGLLMNPQDETIPPDIADPYSLSKQVDEHTLQAVCRRFGASGVALRLPLMVSSANRGWLTGWKADQLAESAGEGWGWLDVRDAAEAFRLAITGDYDGVHVLHVAAPDVFADEPTEELLARYAPDVPCDGRFADHAVPVDTSRAYELLGFVPRFDRSTTSEER